MGRPMQPLTRAILLCLSAAYLAAGIFAGFEIGVTIGLPFVVVPVMLVGIVIRTQRDGVRLRELATGLVSTPSGKSMAFIGAVNALMGTVDFFANSSPYTLLFFATFIASSWFGARHGFERLPV